MSVHVLLNLSNEFAKSDTMRGLSSILSLFRNNFTKFNNAGDSIIIWRQSLSFFCVKTSRLCHIYVTLRYGRHNITLPNL